MEKLKNQNRRRASYGRKYESIQITVILTESVFKFLQIPCNLPGL